MFNSVEGYLYEVWVEGTHIATTELLEVNNTELQFADFAIENTDIDALIRVA